MRTIKLSKKNISLSKLSREINVPKSSIANWEAGIGLRLNEQNMEYLERLSNYFNVPVQTILFGHFDHDSKKEVLFESTFRDGFTKYRFRIEKISD